MPSSRRRSRPLSNAVKMSQMGLAAPAVMSHRLARLAQAGPLPSAVDLGEFQRMVAEKPMAFAQAWFGMASAMMSLQQQWFAAWLRGRPGWVSPGALGWVAGKGIDPIHAKVMGNSRRLVPRRRR